MVTGNACVRIAPVIAVVLMALCRGGAGAAEATRPLAVLDPLALRELDLREHRDAASPHPGLSLHAMLDPDGPQPFDAKRLLALPAMAALVDELEKSDPPDHDPSSTVARFALAGVVARLDRGFVAADGCGEVRLIYRPFFPAGETSQRLPMTLNLVLRARGAGALSCVEIARRWLAAADARETGAEAARTLLAERGALAPLGPSGIDRLEINVQIAAGTATSGAAFRTHYLMKVFRLDAATQRFVEAPMENQIDRDRLRADRTLGEAFRRFLLEPDNLVAFDRGTLIIPDQYLANRAVAEVPAAFTRSPARPGFGLAGPDSTDPLFTDADIVTALQRAAERGFELRNIRSPAGFERRLNDVTCSGCHQTLGVGGFHLPGADWSTRRSGQAPSGSPHFLADQPRRRDIALALRDGRAPDYSRGFADRPQQRQAPSDGADGWGAHCARPDANGARDPSFGAWGCAEGLACQKASGAAADFPIGMCFVGER
jgi:hypothetical protein